MASSAHLQFNVNVPWLRQLLPFHCRGPGLILGQSMWDMWWTRWHRGQFYSKCFTSPVCIILSALHTRSSVTDGVQSYWL